MNGDRQPPTVLVKNTFIQVEDRKLSVDDVMTMNANSRPRTESCDAVISNCHDRTFVVTTTLTPICETTKLPVQRFETKGVDEEEDAEDEDEEERRSCDNENDEVLYDNLPSTKHDKTTIMLRNIPNKYTQQMLLDAVNEEFRGLYDFFYLPIDFKNKCNVGYAFINFVHPYYAELFSKKFSGLKLQAFKSKKVCDVSWGRVQGLKANIEHYRNSAIMSIPHQQYKPLIFKDGIALPFPDPVGPLPQVKPRHGKNAGHQQPSSQSATDAEAVQ